MPAFSLITCVIGAFIVGGLLANRFTEMRHQVTLAEREMDVHYLMDSLNILLAACQAHHDDETTMLAIRYARQTLELRFGKSRGKDANQ